MKYTLLELVQRVLSSIKGEEVNSFSDTAESLIVRDIIKECYLNLISNQNFPELYTFFELNASGDNTKPVLMTVPENVLSLSWIKYNGQYVKYMEPTAYHDMQLNFDIDADNVDSMVYENADGDTIRFRYYTDRDPLYFTSIDDTTLIFDGHTLADDDTLTKNKTECWGLRSNAWEDVDSFTPRLDPQQFMILLKEAKDMAFTEIRLTTNASAQAQARKAKIKAEQKKHRVGNGYYDYYQQLPHMGRK